MYSIKIVVTHWRVLKLFTGEDFDVGEVKKVNNLWLVRHPETALNSRECMRGHVDVGLTLRGTRQIEDVLKALARDKGDTKFSLSRAQTDAVAVYSSDLPRAAVVGDSIANMFNLPLFLTYDLRPADLGELTGKPIKDVVHILQQIDVAGDAGQFPGGETIKDFKTRITRVFNYLSENSD